MANLKRFFNPALTSGARVDLYFNGRSHIKIGDGLVETLNPLHAKMAGKGEIIGIRFDFKVEIMMPDESPAGTCKIKIDDGDWKETTYKTVGDQLHITEGNVVLYPSSWHWTIVGVQTPKAYAWVGVWPQGKAIAAENFEALPAV
jgi:hypothetical protein